MNPNIPPPTKDSHCSYCGSKFAEQILWPRKCFICGNDSYKNPIPIVVSIIPVNYEGLLGILIQQRGINPEKGNWAFPSGYINHGESWQEAAVRENEEEMNFFSKEDDYKLWDIKKSTTGNMLIFCRYLKIWDDQVKEFIERFIPNEEVMALGVNWGQTSLAFPSHNECAGEFLEKLQNTQTPWLY